MSEIKKVSDDVRDQSHIINAFEMAIGVTLHPWQKQALMNGSSEFKSGLIGHLMIQRTRLDGQDFIELCSGDGPVSRFETHKMTSFIRTLKDLLGFLEIQEYTECKNPECGQWDFSQNVCWECGEPKQMETEGKS